MSTSPEFRGFDLVRRGYDREQVDRYLRALSEAGSPPPQPAFPIRWRGYDRDQVDARIADLLRGRGGSA
ncbi:DivIVA domain-containing protein [Kitasatospora sp. NPDC058063]|uniref:DivIVA domain-containing protein n=1 Tax=unclassified Kitasatospora TaxID=2633591 RepID=UPI0036DBC8D5